MSVITRLRPAELVASPAFTHVAVIPPTATTVLVGGQNAVDASGALVGGDDVGAQTRQVMRNVTTALAAAGASLDDLVSCTVLLVDSADVRAAYTAAAETLPTGEGAPLVTAARVAGLGVPGALVEVSVIAAIPT